MSYYFVNRFVLELATGYHQKDDECSKSHCIFVEQSQYTCQPLTAVAVPRVINTRC